MNGFIARTARSVCLLGGLIGMVGCAHYHDVVDPCYPERYEAMAHKEVEQAFTPQVQNGHVLDQTVFDSFFHPGTADLTTGGIDHLNYILRRRPCADTNIYLQSALILPTDAMAASGIAFDPANSAKMIESRNKLNQDRKEMVEKYLVAASNGRGLAFNVDLIDVATPGMSAIPSNLTVRMRYLGPTQGQMPIQGPTAPISTVTNNTNAFP